MECSPHLYCASYKAGREGLELFKGKTWEENPCRCRPVRRGHLGAGASVDSGRAPSWPVCKLDSTAATRSSRPCWGERALGTGSSAHTQQGGQSSSSCLYWLSPECVCLCRKIYFKELARDYGENCRVSLQAGGSGEPLLQSEDCLREAALSGEGQSFSIQAFH